MGYSHALDVLKSIPKYCDSGVYGITIEGMKKTQSSKSFIKFMGDWVYPVDILKRRFKEIKQCAHDNGLKFFSAENRLRSMGDSLTCCGCEGLDGFNVFKGNLNQFRHDKANYKFDKVSQKDGSGYVFKALRQDTIGAQIMMKSKFKDLMDAYCKDSKYQKIVGYSGD